MLVGLSEQDREWLARGVDIGMIRENLQLSYEARIVQHQQTLNTIQALHEMMRGQHEPDPGPFRVPH